MGLVSVCGIIVPWRRPELYRGSTSQRRFLGVPVVTIAGVGGVLTCAFVWVLFFHYSAQFGFSSPGKFFGFAVVTIGLAVVYYLVARFIRSRAGVNIDLVYAEIPPE